LAKTFELHEYRRYSEEREPYTVSRNRNGKRRAGRLLECVRLLAWGGKDRRRLDSQLSGPERKELHSATEELSAHIFSVLSNISGRAVEKSTLAHATTFLVDAMTDPSDKPSL
jgi:hypothetical protein